MHSLLSPNFIEGADVAAAAPLLWRESRKVGQGLDSTFNFHNFTLSYLHTFIFLYFCIFSLYSGSWCCALGRVRRNLTRVGFHFHTFALAYFHTFLKRFLTPCLSEKTSLLNICSPLNVINHSRPAYVSLRSANLGQPMVTRPAMMLILKPNHHHGFFQNHISRVLPL